jgi:hypothetical protein
MNTDDSIHRRVFDALPVPATIIDCRGIILDINRAFLQYAHERGRKIARADRVGKHIGDFAGPQQRRFICDFVDKLFAKGKARTRQIAPPEMNPDMSYMVIEGEMIRNAEGETVGAIVMQKLLDDPAWHDERRTAMARLRDAIWAMNHSNDMDIVMAALREGLEQLTLPFYAYGVNFVHAEQGALSVTCYTDSGQGDGQWMLIADGTGVRVLGEIWRGQQVVYRRTHPQRDRCTLCLWHTGGG